MNSSASLLNRQDAGDAILNRQDAGDAKEREVMANILSDTSCLCAFAVRHTKIA